MDYSNMDIVFVYSGEFFKDVELESIKRLFEVFSDSDKIETRKLEKIVNNPKVINRFLTKGLIIKDGSNYRIQEEKVQELVDATLGTEADFDY